MTIPRIKICCISSIDEARLALKYGASALGLVSAMPSGPGVIRDELITEIVKSIPAGTDTFVLTSNTTAAGIIEQHSRFNSSTLQLVDEVSKSELEIVRKELKGIKLVQVIHVTDEGSVEQAKDISPYADALLLDSGNPNLKVKELGGTGRVHDWKLSRMIRDSVSIPVYLAGGLNPDNAANAIRSVDPYALDLCSGVRTNGMLDEDKLSKFFKAAGY